MLRGDSETCCSVPVRRIQGLLVRRDLAWQTETMGPEVAGPSLGPWAVSAPGTNVPVLVALIAEELPEFRLEGRTGHSAGRVAQLVSVAFASDQTWAEQTKKHAKHRNFQTAL